MGLIFLDGGPLDGTAYDTKDLLGTPESALPHGYVWTSARRTSTRTGQTAQVWRYAGDALAPQESPGKVAHTASAEEIAAADALVTETEELGLYPDQRVEQIAAAGPALRARRDAAGATRKTVCELTGLKSSRLVAIEGGTGKPVTEAERAALEEALARLESEASAP